MKVRALLLEGEFKAELPKYDLPEAVSQLLGNEYNIADPAILKPGLGRLPFGMLLGTCDLKEVHLGMPYQAQ
jgi:hypothetical protein